MPFVDPRKRYTGLTLDSLPQNPGLGQPAYGTAPAMGETASDFQGRITPSDTGSPRVEAIPVGAQTPGQPDLLRDNPAFAEALKNSANSTQVPPAPASSSAPNGLNSNTMGILQTGMMGAGMMSKGINGSGVQETAPPPPTSAPISRPSTAEAASMMQNLLNSRMGGMGGMGGLGGMGGMMGRGVGGMMRRRPSMSGIGG